MEYSTYLFHKLSPFILLIHKKTDDETFALNQEILIRHKYLRKKFNTSRYKIIFL